MRRGLVAALFGIATLVAASVQAGDIQISNAWSRPTTQAARTAAIYLTVQNTGTAPDRLLGASGADADRIELHEHQMEGDIARMRPVEGGVPLPAGTSITAQPGGLHLMLLGLRHPLRVGDSVPLTLHFERAGDVAATALVLPVGRTP